MHRLSLNTPDESFVALIDRWAALLEAEDYDDAFALTDHMPDAGWDAEVIEEVIKAYGDQNPAQKVTMHNDEKAGSARRSSGIRAERARILRRDLVRPRHR